MTNPPSDDRKDAEESAGSEVTRYLPDAVPATGVTLPVSDPVVDAFVTRAPEADGSQTRAQLPSTEAHSAAPASADHVPRQIADYEIQSELGRGGMGVVYKARHTQLDRVVALKMILAGAYAGAAERARFRTEAESVARIHHPGIVQIYGIGECEGRPFFALEYLPGGTLADRLDGTPHPAAEAARLTEQLARAVHAAHGCGVIHRDLKPANVFFTTDGQPKVGDFGLAKRLDSVQTRTQTGAVLGTPSYMAPEQAAGQTHVVGPAADVYALGAVLYELLTGRPPFNAATVLETLEQVRSEEPVAPRDLRPRLPRDLNTICLKCLEKDPGHRYASAQDLAEDCAAFLRSEPVKARPTPTWERAWKWARRRPSTAALVGVSVLAALALLGVWARFTVEVRAERDRAMQATQRAEANFDRAVQAVDQLLTEVAEEQLAAEPRMERKRRVLLEKALGYYNEFLAEKGDDPAVRGRTALAARRVGDIRRLLGQYGPAQEAYRQAIVLMKEAVGSGVARPDQLRHLAECHNYLGEAQRRAGDLAGALESYQRSSELYRRLETATPGEPGSRQGLARTYYNRGITLNAMGRPADARRELDAAVVILEQLAKEFPGSPAYRQELARALLNLAPVLRASDPPAAEATGARAVEILTRLVQDFPDHPDYRHELGVTYNNAGNLFRRQRRLPEAVTAHRQAQRLFSDLARDFPAVPDYRKELANADNSLALALAAQGAWPEAFQAVRASRDSFSRLMEEFPGSVEFQAGLGRAQGNLGAFHLRQDHLAEARTELSAAICQSEAAVKSNPGDRSSRLALRNEHEDLAETLVRLGDHAAAAPIAAALPSFLREGRDSCRAAGLLACCANLADKDPKLEAAARRHAAAAHTRQALSILAEAVGRGAVMADDLDKEPALDPLRRRDEGRAGLARLREAALQRKEKLPSGKTAADK
jgi:serine/threonine-protein kinase